jgi:hypothetical protein
MARLPVASALEKFDFPQTFFRLPERSICLKLPDICFFLDHFSPC